MTVPFDPEAVTGADFGEQRATLSMDHEAAIEHVRSVCVDAGFGVPVEFSPAALLNEKVDADRDPYYVLGACNPQMADAALDATDGRIGALFPCNMVIKEEAPGEQVVYHVSIMKIATLLGLDADEAAMEDVLETTGSMVETVFDRLE